MTKYCFCAAVVYLIFVIYGSLVPLDYQSIPWQQARDKFHNIPYLALGIESRADWIANIVLYMPLAFLWTMLLGNMRSVGLRVVWAIIVLSSCVALAVVIEFCQLYFPPRTVSINDLIAEAIGTVMGLLLAATLGKHWVKLINNLALSALPSSQMLIVLYLSSYLAVSFFPFDFVTSFAELDIKLAGSQDDIFMSLDICQHNAVRCVVKIIVEILILMPVGALFYNLPHVAHKLALAILVGFFLGIFSELIQLFLYSGIGQGISILTRMLGMGLGVRAAQWLEQQDWLHWQKRLKPMILMLLLPYVLLVFVINGGMEGAWLSVDLAYAKLAETRFMPFFYFYYTTETIALLSVISNLGLYIPIGCAYCLWYTPKAISWIWVGMGAVVLAIMVETEKLFLANKHPDPTDLGIAFVAAAISYVLMNKALHWQQQDTLSLTLKQRF